MDVYKAMHEKSSGLRPYGGDKPKFQLPPLRFPSKDIDRHEIPEQPLTPGSIHSAPKNWYVSPFLKEDESESEEEDPFMCDDEDDPYYMSANEYDEWVREYEEY
jgi:hypothetical protein